MKPPIAASTLLVVLGASQFPEIALKGSVAFLNAARQLTDYFLDPHGFDLPEANLVYCFDSSYDPSALDREITRRISTRLEAMSHAGNPARDLLVYYVGHGSFDEHRKYYLALRGTRAVNQSVSSLKVQDLVTTLDAVAGSLRRFLIIDACYAAEAFGYAQSAVTDAVAVQLEKLPTRGLTVLCSSAADSISEFLPDESGTRFTQALCAVLWDGDAKLGGPLTFAQVRDLVEEHLRSVSVAPIRPEIHNIGQFEGELDSIGFFPNGPRRQQREKATQAERHRREADAEERYRRTVADAAQREAEELQRIKAKTESERRGVPTKRHRELASQIDVPTWRAAAETRQPGPLDLGTMKRWVTWKAKQHEDVVETLRVQADLHRNAADKARFYRGNVLDHVNIQRKSGSDDSARSLGAHAETLRIQSVDEDRKADEIMDQTALEMVSLNFFRERATEVDFVDRCAALASARGCSFEAIVNAELAPLLASFLRLQALDNFKAAILRWLKRLVILAAVLLVAYCTFNNHPAS